MQHTQRHIHARALNARRYLPVPLRMLHFYLPPLGRDMRGDMARSHKTGAPGKSANYLGRRVGPQFVAGPETLPAQRERVDAVRWLDAAKGIRLSELRHAV